KLHSAENCYVAQGGRCETMDAMEDEAGHVWARFRYHGETGSQTVRQCYFAIDPAKPAADLDEWITNVPSWPDVSSWYWNAALPNSEVHYTLAVTVAAPS